MNDFTSAKAASLAERKPRKRRDGGGISGDDERFFSHPQTRHAGGAVSSGDTRCFSQQNQYGEHKPSSYRRKEIAKDRHGLPIEASLEG
jgi:hypothetical protein